MIVPSEPYRRPQQGAPDESGLLGALLESLPSHVAVLDEQGTIVAVSGAWGRFWRENGGESGGGVGTNYLATCEASKASCGDAGTVAAGIRRVMDGLVPEFHHAYPCHSPTERRWFQLRARRLEWSGPPRVLVMHESITEVSLSEQALRERLADNAHASRLFVIGGMAAELAHELNQPLTSVLNYIRGARRRMASGDRPGEIVSVMDLIEQQTERAAAIIARVRGFAGKRPSGRERVDLLAVALQACGLCALDAERGGVAVRVSSSVSAGVVVSADPVQLQQVMVNAVRNAIEATAEAAAGAGAGKPGVVFVDVRRGAGEESESGLFEVTDEGTGLSHAAEAGLFEAFHSTKKHGLGLGLSICRSIAEDHGGRVRLINRPDTRGAVFTLTLPLLSSAEVPLGR